MFAPLGTLVLIVMRVQLIRIKILQEHRTVQHVRQRAPPTPIRDLQPLQPAVSVITIIHTSRTNVSVLRFSVMSKLVADPDILERGAGGRGGQT